MKIGIDIQTTLGQKTGFGYYVENLVNELQKQSGHNYALIQPTTEQDFNAPRRFLWDQFGAPRQARLAGVDLFHQPAFSAPVFYNRPVVVTVHDLIAVHFGEDIPLWSRQYFGRWMPYSYRYAAHIIAISQHTKKDIMQLLHVPEEKISVIYEAADSKFKVISDQNKIKDIKKKYNLADKFILHMGTLNPRKNLQFLVSVFAQVTKEFPDYQLVIVGKKGWHYESLFQQVKDLGLEKKVVFVGYIDEQDKVLMYNAASLYAFPSLYEGFGLPLLEAMACGVPVVSSDRSSLPEILGDAGLKVDPTDIKSWVDSVSQLLRLKTKRDEYTQKGIIRARKFSWTKTAQETIQVYNHVLKVDK